MKRGAYALFFSFFLALLLRFTVFVVKNPPEVYVDPGACPFECCVYREWGVLQDVELVDSPGGLKVVGEALAGEKVQAITGEVHTIPLEFTLPEDFELSDRYDLQPGDRVFLLTYIGEGYWKLWHEGKVVSGVEIDDPPRPESRWWVRVRTAAGVTGWTLSGGNFDDRDACS